MKDNLSNEINELIKDNNFSGVVSIRKNGEIIFERAAGYADRSNKREINRYTKFGIASGTKLFTAVAIGTLIDAGKLDLHTKVFDVIQYNFPKYSKEITVQHLLTHTAGIPDYFDEDEIEDFDNFTVAMPWQELKSPKDYFKIFPNKVMKSVPGVAFSYCNSGYILLGAIIEEVSGISYQEYVKMNVFDKAGMTDSDFYPLNQLPENTAYGYIDTDEGWRTNIYNLPIVGGGDGGAFSTIDDLYKFWDCLYAGKIISKELLKIYLKPYVEVNSNHIYYGQGLWIHNGENVSRKDYIIGCDAGVSFKSVAIQDGNLIYTVISNTGDSAWPITKALFNVLV